MFSFAIRTNVVKPVLAATSSDDAANRKVSLTDVVVADSVAAVVVFNYGESMARYDEI